MKKIIALYTFLVVCTMVLQAQVRETAIVLTDKDCYLAGEDMWVKMFVTDNENAPTFLSKVGYVEACNTERSHVQLKLALVGGKGWGRVRIPASTPTGVYRLTGYTRFIRNGGEDAYFKKEIAIINAFNTSDADRFEVVGEKKTASETPTAGNIMAVTDKPEYTNRSLVKLSLRALPADTRDITVSVFRDDALTTVAKTLSFGNKEVTYSEEWLPEYEGHLMSGRILTVDGKKCDIDSVLDATLAFVGKDLRFTYGRKDKGEFLFNTGGAYGKQEVVVAAESLSGIPLRVDLKSPFSETLPKELPVLKLYADKDVLQERSIGVQLQQIMILDSVGDSHPLDEKYYDLKPAISYDWDQYTRFSSIRETFVEYVNRIHLAKVNGETIIKVLNIEAKRYSTGKALVLLDGVPIYNHENMLSYNPYLIKKLDIFDGRFEFGGAVFDSMVSFVSHKGRLMGLRLGEESQLVIYDCPHKMDTFESPVYDRSQEGMRKPDFRHTLYWNPDVKMDNKDLCFYTSDLCGKFKVAVKVVTTDGRIVEGEGHFTVK